MNSYNLPITDNQNIDHFNGIPHQQSCSYDEMCENLEDDVTPLAQTRDYFDNEMSGDNSFVLIQTKPFDLSKY